MGEADRDAAAVRFPPPFVPLLALGAGVLLQRFAYRLPLLSDTLWLRVGIGCVLLLLGVGAMGVAIRQFRHTGQDPTPWKSTPEILATGIYRFTRNPMYLGMGLVQAAIGVGIGNLWVVVLVPATWLVIYAIAIRHEEAYLTRKFGDAYTSYMQSVRRWI